MTGTPQAPHPTAPRRWTLGGFPDETSVFEGEDLELGERVEVKRLHGIIDDLTPERRCECGHLEDEHTAGSCGGVVRSLNHPQGVPFYRPCSCAGFRECS